VSVRGLSGKAEAGNGNKSIEHTGIRVLRKSKAFWPARLAIIDQPKTQYLARAAEDVDDLFFGQACRAVSLCSILLSRRREYVP
jgi:hypothetical protein